MQKCLLIACSVRLGTYLGNEFKQPIACLSYKSNMACPMVPWTCVQASALRSKLYLYLLHRMGLLPDNSAGIYPRIPAEWDADTLYSVALFLGKVEASDVDFDLHQVHQVDLPIPCTSHHLPSGKTIFVQLSTSTSTCCCVRKVEMGYRPMGSAFCRAWVVSESGAFFFFLLFTLG